MGLIDVESEKLNAFTEDDRDFLEHAAFLIVARVEVSAGAGDRPRSNWLAAGLRCIGQIPIEKPDDDSFALCHREDAGRDDLRPTSTAEDAAELARFDDAGNYRPLKTAPNLRHGWRLKLAI